MKVTHFGINLQQTIEKSNIWQKSSTFNSRGWGEEEIN